MIAAQLAVYPLGESDVDGAVAAALDALTTDTGGSLTIEVGPMSTVVTGPDDHVWAAVRRLFDAAARDGHRVVLTATLSNECGCD